MVVHNRERLNGIVPGTVAVVSAGAASSAAAATGVGAGWATLLRIRKCATDLYPALPQQPMMRDRVHGLDSRVGGGGEECTFRNGMPVLGASGGPAFPDAAHAAVADVCRAHLCQTC